MYPSFQRLAMIGLAQSVSFLSRINEQFCSISSRVSVLFSSVQSLSCVWLFVTLWITARLASLSITNFRSLPKLMSIESVMSPSHLIICCPFSSCPQSLPGSGSFPMSQLFAWGGQSIEVSASASVLPMKTQDWFPLGWTRCRNNNLPEVWEVLLCF